MDESADEFIEVFGEDVGLTTPENSSDSSDDGIPSPREVELVAKPVKVSKKPQKVVPQTRTAAENKARARMKKEKAREKRKRRLAKEKRVRLEMQAKKKADREKRAKTKAEFNAKYGRKKNKKVSSERLVFQHYDSMMTLLETENVLLTIQESFRQCAPLNKHAFSQKGFAELLNDELSSRRGDTVGILKFILSQFSDPVNRVYINSDVLHVLVESGLDSLIKSFCDLDGEVKKVSIQIHQNWAFAKKGSATDFASLPFEEPLDPSKAEELARIRDNNARQHAGLRAFQVVPAEKIETKQTRARVPQPMNLGFTRNPTSRFNLDGVKKSRKPGPKHDNRGEKILKKAQELTKKAKARR